MSAKPNENRNLLFGIPRLNYWITSIINSHEFQWNWLTGDFVILSVMHILFLCQQLFFNFSKFISSFFHFDRLQSRNKILEALIYNPVFFISSQKTAISNLLNMSHEQTKTLEILTGPPVLNDHMHPCILVSAKTKKRKPNSAAGCDSGQTANRFTGHVPLVHRAFNSLVYTLPLLTWRLVEELSRGSS